MSHRRHADSAEEMVGDSQADCAERDESGCPAGSYQSCRISYVWRHPDHCTTARRRCEPLTPRMLPKYGGLIVTPHAAASVHRSLVVALAARYKLPAVYPFRYHATGGGLISYGPDLVDQFRLAAGYVDRILKGEKPADLPVQAPTKYEMVINLKTAKALGLNVPNALIGRADEVIE
jgi:ABC transporter substrate binding protein